MDSTKIVSGLVAIGAFVVVLMLVIMFGCVRIDPGHVGIKVNMAGSQRGVEDFPARTGWVFYNRFTSKVFEYPIFVQTAQWTKNPDEGSPTNEEITFNTKEGMLVTADISLSYSLDPAKVPHFYVKFRSDDLNTFTHGFLRNIARDQFNEVASTYGIEDIYGAKKEQFLVEVRKRIQNQVAEVGIKLEQFGFIGAPRPPQSFVEALNAKATATQRAQQAENELRQATAEAQKLVAKTAGEAQARVAQAEGDAKANELITRSLSPQLIQWRQLELQGKAIDKWNGVRPTVESGSGGGLLLQIPTATK